MRQNNLHLFRNNVKQLAGMVAAFVVVICLLEAKGLVIWAQRLDVGWGREQALSVTQGMEQFLDGVAKPIINIRPQALQFLAEQGWSDVPTNQAPSKQDSTDQEEESNAEEPADTTESSDPATEQVAAPSSDAPSTPALQQPPKRFKNGHLAPLPTLAPESVRRIVLAGDSMMAVGLAPQIQRELLTYKGSYEIKQAYRSATGLARPDVFNWIEKYPAMIGENRPDVVIVAIGANDTQNLQEGRDVLKIGSEEWKTAYEVRLKQYLDLLTEEGTIVLWIKLPPMRPAKYNRNINAVNEVAEKVVHANPHAIWWDVSDRFLSQTGQFLEFTSITQGGKKVRIRQSDGIHLTEDGTKLISADLLQWLNLRSADAPVTKAPAEQATLATDPLGTDAPSQPQPKNTDQP